MHIQKKRKRFLIATVTEGYGLRKYAAFSNPSSHKVRQLTLRSASKQSLSVLAFTLAVDRGAVSVLRTASGMPDNRSSPVFRVADGERLSMSLAPAVLGGGWCALVPQSSA